MSRLLKQQAVGRHVRKLRESARMSLRALAARTDFSPSFISQLENGQVSPSIGSMEKIAGVLGTTLAEFFAGVGEAASGVVVRVAERRRIPSGWSHGEVETLSTPLRSGRSLEGLLVTLEPGGRSGKHPSARTGEEFAFVLSGRPTLTLGPDRHVLEPGDAVTILSQELRMWANEGTAAAYVLIVSSRSR